jgi:hypothetical protein
VALTSADLKLVHLVRLQVTGKEGKPVANAVVVLNDAAGQTHQSMLNPARRGEILFEDVAQGKAQVDVAPLSAANTRKEVEIALAKGETVQTVTVGLPEVTAVVDTPAGGATGDTATSAPAAPAPGTAAAPAPAPAPAPAAPLPPPADGGGGVLQMILGFLILGGIGYGLYLYGKKQGWTIEGTMSRLGVSPAPTEDAARSGPGPAPGPVPPPPVVADPNRCQFCGELKDPASGACACTVSATGAPAFGGAAPFAPTAPSGGPRLIATAGVYAGEIFRLSGEAVLGRDPLNSIPLDRDTTVSRRHARLVPENGAYRLIDEGSSNGTFVNGAKVG